MAELSDNMRGAVYMAAGMAMLTMNDALAKSVGGEMTVYQTMFIRGVMVSVLIAALAGWRGDLFYRVGRADLVLIGLRLVGGTGSTICFLNALFQMPIANLSAISQSMPLAMTLGASLFLGETVGWRRYVAIGVGFSGVLLIARPGAEGFNAASLWAIASVGFATLRDLSTRRMGRAVPSLFVTLTTALGVTVTGGVVSAIQPWPPVSAENFAIMALAALFLTAGWQFNVLCMRHGEIGFVVPFRYTVLIWAILLGFVGFGEVPGPMTLAGSAVIVGTGLYTFYREQRARRREAKRLAAAARPA